MHSLATLFVLALCLSAASFVRASEDVYSKDSPIVTLTAKTSEEALKNAKNFEQTIKDNELVLVKFYAPWCGHCKKMVAGYEAAANELKKAGSKVVLAKVDVTAESELGQKYEIQGFPTLKFFRNGTPENYDGGRTTEAILAWIKKMTGPAVEVVADKAAAEKLATGSGVISFVGAFKAEDSPAYKTFALAANKSRAVGKFIAYIAKDAADEVTVHRNGEGFVAKHTVQTEEELVKFANEEKFPYFGPISGENFALYSGSGISLAWYTGTAEDYKKSGEVMREVGKTMRGKVHLVWLDTAQFGSHAENQLGVKDFPALVLQIKEARYVFPEAVSSTTAAKVSDFLTAAAEGKVERSIKSEAIPETNDEPVKVVVSKTFKEMVFHDDKDVLLEVYAPWCGHCKKLEPVYNKVAEMVAPHKHLVLAKMDGTANESPVEGFDWNGFPTIFFVKAGSKTPVQFDGDRSEEGIYTYLMKNGSKKIPEYKKLSSDDEKKDEL